MNKAPHSIISAGFVIILLTTVFAYSDIKNHEFLHWDDNFYIDGNTHIHALNWNNILWMFTEHASANWHPITWMSYAINYQFWGKNAFVFKITNVILHLLTSFLVFFLTYKLTSIIARSNPPVINAELFAIFAGLFAALIFSIHPQHVESVAWISGRKDILCTLFYLAAIVSYITQTENKDSRKWNQITLSLFVLALMSKSMAVTLPLVLMLLDIYPLKRVNQKDTAWLAFKALIANKLHYFLIAGCVGGITLITQNNEMQTLTSFSLGDRIVHASVNILHYLYTIFYPFHLQAYYPLNIESGEHPLSQVLATGTVAGIFAACLFLWKRGKKYYLAIWAFYIIALLPVIGLIKVGHASAADRYAYLPTIGFYILLGTAISYMMFFDKRPFLKSATIGGFSFLACFLAVKTDINTQRWANDMTLWSSVTEAFPGQVIVAYNNLGGAYIHQKQYANAIEEFNNAVAIQPNNIGALENIATCYTRLGRIDVALRYYMRSVELNPDVAEPYITLGDFYNVRKNISLADEYYQRAFEISPSSPKTLIRSAYMDYVKGDYNNADFKLSYLEKLNPGDLRGLQLQAKIKLAENNLADAGRIAGQILSLRPQDKLALEILAKVQDQGAMQ